MSDRQAPYPADTRAKGWRFELDYEQIEQSDTWDLAGADGRPWLLMMWLVSWRQAPCGSMPSDEQVIAAKIGASPKTWLKHRAALLRGWYAAADGRLYHPTVSARVMEMLEYRRKNAERVAKFKAAKREERAGNALPPREQQDSNDTGTGTGTNLKPKAKTKPARERAPIPACPDGVTEETWRDWLALRKEKRATVSETVIREAQAESVKAGMTFDAFLRVWCVRVSQGLQADWLKPHERGGTVQPISRFIKGTSLDPDFRGYEDHATAALR